MKANLPSTWTSQKIGSLLLLSLLHLQEIEAGESFRNCLKHLANDTSSYDLLLKFPFNSNNLINNDEQLELNCNSSQCTVVDFNKSNFYCRKFLDKIFCGQYPTCCTGIVGNQSITERKSVYGSNCQVLSENRDKFDLMMNIFNSNKEFNFTQNYALFNGTDSDYSLRTFCNWDNGGWVCPRFEPRKEYCHMEWPTSWPGPIDKNPAPWITPTSSSSDPTITNPLPTASPNNNDNHLAEKIVIPIATVSGTSLIAGLTYYYCKKRKNKQSASSLSISNNERVEAENSKTEDIELVANELAKLTPPHTPDPQRSPQQLNDPKELLLTQLRNRLIGQEQLWNDYLEVNQLLTANPASNLILKNFNQIQNQLLQFLTIGEIALLLENEASNSVRNPHTEYTEFIEEVRNPHALRYSNPQYWN
ncbi:MAG: hypothetical protein mread185_000093 [Mycoplasmataceae bacterium]|nr:MAG: hypothetical protein mread185_000093 [Mycoplasmataceae bacterium]